MRLVATDDVDSVDSMESKGSFRYIYIYRNHPNGFANQAKMSIDCPDLSCVGETGFSVQPPRGSLNQGGLVSINSHDMCNDI